MYERMKNDTSRVLFDYWNRIRGARRAPRRLEVEPSRIVSILPEAFILERSDADTFRFRVAGTQLCEQFGLEFRGRNFLEPWEPEDRLTLKQRLTAITEEGAVGLFEFEAFGPSQEAVIFEVLIVPLVQKDSIDRFLGTMSTTQDPPWLGLERLERRQLLRHTLIWPEGLPPRPSHFRPAMFPEIRDARLVRVDRRAFRVYDGGLSRPMHEKR